MSRTPIDDLDLNHHSGAVLTHAGQGGGLHLTEPSGEPLDRLLASLPDHRLPLREALATGCGVARILARVHQQGWVHRAVRPRHILLDRAAGRVALGGLDAATRLPREWIEPDASTGLADELDHLAPEETGRTGRPVDDRSDLYSLGTVLFEMLAGSPPFPSADPLETIHGHLARQPPSPCEVVDDLPEAVGEIVRKLLAKAPEDRYQSATGLADDLERCSRQLAATGGVAPFDLGATDVPARFELPEGLFGRDDEMARLWAAFEATRRGATPILALRGAAGVGKTALAAELRRRVLEAGGRFAAGSYGEPDRAMPLSGFLDALRDLVRSLLSEDAVQIAGHRRALETALGDELDLLTPLVPELTILTGRPAHSAAGPADGNAASARRRFFRAATLLLRTLVTPQRPLALFLDDVQHIDNASLELSKAMGTMGAKSPASILWVAAGRDEAWQRDHPLGRHLDALVEAGGDVEVMELGGLDRTAVSAFIAAAFATSTERAAPLAELVSQRTQGNPLLMRADLTHLHEEGLLRFALDTTGAAGDTGRPGWTWDLDRIAAREEPVDMARLAARRMAQLAPEARRTVALASVFGPCFDAAALSHLSHLAGDPDAVEAALLTACQEDVLVKRGDDFWFAADALRERAYQQLSDGERAAAHLAIGRFLGGREEARIFDVVHHLNLAGELLVDAEERLDTARLDLMAGQRAAASSSFTAAYDLFASGLELLGPDAWEEAYDVALALSTGAADAAVQSADFAAAETWTRAIHRHARTLLDELPAYEAEVSAALARRREKEALGTCLTALARLGVELPAETDPEAVRERFLAIHRAVEPLLGRDPAQLERLEDPRRLAALRLLSRVALVAGWTNHLLYGMTACTMLEITVEEGHGPESPAAWTMLGSLRCRFLRDHEGGYRAGIYGLRLSEEPGLGRMRALARLIFEMSINPLRRHRDEAVDGFEAARREALDSGDLLSAGTCAFLACVAGLHAGTDLEELEKDCRQHLRRIHRAGLGRILPPFEQVHRIVLTLLGRLDAEAAFAAGDEAWEGGVDQNVRQVVAAGEALLAGVLRRGDRLATLVPRAAALTEAGAEALVFFDVHLCLAFFDPCALRAAEERRELRLAIAAQREKIEARAASNPESYAHKRDLVEAEHQRCRGRSEQARPLYDAAIEGARRHRYPNDAARACELAAELHDAGGRPHVATFYRRGAADAYAAWGARGRLRELLRRHPELLSPPAPQSTSTDPFDRTSLERAAQALGRQLDLRELLRDLLAILLQNAGAQRGFLLRHDGERLVIESRGDLDAGGVRPVDDQALEASDELCGAVVRYVSRSRETVVLGDALRDERFAADPYLRRERPRSILCAPILHQGRPAAILYLENHRVRNAFNAARLEAVRLISSQAAAALENARLLEVLKTKNAELATRNAEMERFIYTVSHDLKSPLLSIRGFLGLLERDLESDDRQRQADDMARIHEAAAKMARLLDELLELSRVGRQMNAPEHVELSEIAHEAVGLLAGRLAERPAEIFVDPELPAIVGDRVRLIEVFQNLIDNALKATRDVEGPRIEVVAREGPEGPVVQVCDNGVGIDPRYQEKVFELFERLDLHDSTSTGVGLALVQRIVEVHGGRIWVESAGLGQGSAFCFTLPGVEGAEPA